MKALFLVLIFVNLQAIKVAVSTDTNEQMKIAIILRNKLPKADKIFDCLKADLELSDQFIVEKKNGSSSIKEIQKLSPQFPLVLVVSNSSNQIEFKLFESDNGQQLLNSKQKYDSNFLEFYAHKVSEQVWKKLTNEEGCFSSLIAACRNSINNDEKISSIFAFYPSDKFEHKKKLIDSGINLSPNWHPGERCLFFSRHTPVNVQLVSLNGDGKKRVVTNFDGLNITPAFSEKGRIVVSLTVDGKGRLCEYKFDAYKKKGKFISLTPGTMHAFAPSFADENTVVFCLIDEQRRPKVATLNLKTKNIKTITNGSCMSPAYNKKIKEVAYCKKTDNGRQVFKSNLDGANPKQLTNVYADKVSCSWSPCGNYIVFDEDGGKGRIAILSLRTEKKRYLTPASEHWTMPAWSNVFKEPFAQDRFDN